MQVKETRRIQGIDITVTKPGRFTFKEILEYGRRKSFTHKGKKVSRVEKAAVRGSITDQRDESISRTPLLNIIRNPTNAYHVPYTPPKAKEAEAVIEIPAYIETPRESESSAASESD